MPTQLTCTKDNEWAVVLVTDENEGLVSDASSQSFRTELEIFWEVAGRNQNQVLLGASVDVDGETVHIAAESEKKMTHEAFINESILSLKGLEVRAEITGKENDSQ